MARKRIHLMSALPQKRTSENIGSFAIFAAIRRPVDANADIKATVGYDRALSYGAR
jgi:hypothetical protein